jgi:hypothetical protein
MINFHHRTAFQVLLCSVIFTHISTQNRMFLEAQLVDEEPVLGKTTP